MKTLTLLLCFAIAGFSANAQKKKSPTKTNDAAYAKMYSSKQQKLNEIREDAIFADSLRKYEDSIATVELDSTRNEWLTKRLYEIDSSYNESGKALSMQREHQMDLARQNALLYKKVGINNYHAQQISVRDNSFMEKAQSINDDASLTAETKASQLSALAVERRAVMKQVIGTKKEKRLFKAAETLKVKSPSIYVKQDFE